MQEMWVQLLGQEVPLEKEMTTHSSILAWEIPWTEEPGGLQSMGSKKTGHDLVTKQQQSKSEIQNRLFGHCFQIGEGNGNPLQYSCLENPMDGGAWWATVHGVAKSRTRLSDFTYLLIVGLENHKVFFLHKMTRSF